MIGIGFKILAFDNEFKRSFEKVKGQRDHPAVLHYAGIYPGHPPIQESGKDWKVKVE